jgi:hypothetical protein
VLDAYVDFLESRPHFREWALGNHISEGTGKPVGSPERPGGISAVCWEEMRWKPGKNSVADSPVEAGDRVAFA